MFKVVIVDDEKKVRVALQAMINWNQYNFTVISSSASGEAYELIRNSETDLVITDIKTKEKDAFDFINELKQAGYQGEFLILSNYNDYKYIRKGLLLGVADYLLKYELNPESLSQTIERIAGRLNAKRPQDSISIKEESLPIYRKEIQNIITYINYNIDKKITLSMIAKNINLNESYMCTIFKEQVGQSIIQYINQLKMNHAVELIMTTDLLLKDIAERVGINDQFYFYRVFKKYYGISPLKYKTIYLQEIKQERSTVQ